LPINSAKQVCQNLWQDLTRFFLTILQTATSCLVYKIGQIR